MRKLFTRMPEWLVGLLFAVVVVLVLFYALGVGDDPTLAGG